jgi:enoyl-CoA hydratase/carnithine racemase
MIELDYRDDVAILTLNAGDNRWNTHFVREFNTRLDELLERDTVCAMVTRSADAKFFSFGLDVDWRRGEGDGTGGDKSAFGPEFMVLMGRLITFPIPTVCAVNGHGFGAGFMSALSHDVRVMRADRGYLCANEIQIGMAIPDAELALFRHKMSGSAFFDTVQLARRWTGPEAMAAGFVAATAPVEELGELALECARQLAPLGANRALYGESKERIFGKSPSINGDDGAAHLLRHAYH